ncbi:hypothetical protein [Nannocystis punicea]|uniref:DUF11 domain-containing protein n=1 Tax=Nannocystis punicea TaxID=2995304 RepID=A0ABY7GZ04_9BACT|nr:hypothetical protein [Nannocystis poenicansa]WAS92163.1 hypothetical protein O0S08_38770 [Nannocystis poenicansa]
MPRWVTGMSMAIIGAGALLLGARPVYADACMQEVWNAHGNKQKLTCSANDVTLSSVSKICVHVAPGGPQDPDGDGCQNPNAQGQLTCVSGQDFTFTADYAMPLTAQERVDLGLYVSVDGDPNGDLALTGVCEANVLTAANSSTFILSPKDGQANSGDICGDITSEATPQVFSQTITARCNDPEGDGVNLPFCTTWRQPGADTLCDTTVFTTAAQWDAYPGSPSKCNCGVLDIDVFTEPPGITVKKTASPLTVPEQGGQVTYTVEVHNDAQVTAITLTSLLDSVYGDITTAGHDDIVSTTCAKVKIQAGNVPDADPTTVNNPYVCSFTVAMPPGDSGDSVIDLVEVCGVDVNGDPACGDDDAEVTYEDTPANPNLLKDAVAVTNVVTQMDVRFNVIVNNPTTVGDVLTLNTLVDNKFGSITAAHAAGGGFEQVVSTTCGVPIASGGAGTLPATIAPNGSYSCSFVGRIVASPVFDPLTGAFVLTHIDRVSGTATDDDGKSYADPPLGNDATVSISVDVSFP